MTNTTVVEKELANPEFIEAGSNENPGHLEIKNLEVFYGSQPILKGINMQIEAGKVTAIIGPSGCGKTTLLRCLNRLSELTRGCKVRGEILLDGENILDQDPMLLRRRVGMVFQKPNPFPKSIRENILYGVKALKLKVNHDLVVQYCLHKAALWNELKERLHDSALALSTGQQQRLCFARSLAISPEVLLLDEPASALDPVSTSALESSILSMKGQITQVIVTHNMNEARKVSDNLAFLYMGELLENGPTEEVFDNPRNDITLDYISGKLY
jgi:phosphate transport system ATP-binding protein